MLKLKLQLQYFGHMMQRADSLEKTLMQGKSEAGGQSMIEDEMVGWYHQLNGDEFEQALGDGEGQGSLACCSPPGTGSVHAQSRYQCLLSHVITDGTVT